MAKRVTILGSYPQAFFRSPTSFQKRKRRASLWIWKSHSLSHPSCSVLYSPPFGPLDFGDDSVLERIVEKVGGFRAFGLIGFFAVGMPVRNTLPAGTVENYA
jgi:hypothetical protein